MLLDKDGRLAKPHEKSVCPGCHGELLAKCGSIVTWHWAHVAGIDCDPWHEHETEWHLQWKLYLREHPLFRAQIEVPMGEHRADAVMRDGTIVEFQSAYLSPEEIAAREEFYGPKLIWLYRCHWEESLHFGARGFWWKHGAKSMTKHQRHVWWHWEKDNQVARVKLTLTAENRIIGFFYRTPFNSKEWYPVSDYLKTPLITVPELDRINSLFQEARR